MHKVIYFHNTSLISNWGRFILWHDLCFTFSRSLISFVTFITKITGLDFDWYDILLALLISLHWPFGLWVQKHNAHVTMYHTRSHVLTTPLLTGNEYNFFIICRWPMSILVEIVSLSTLFVELLHFQRCFLSLSFRYRFIPERVYQRERDYSMQELTWWLWHCFWNKKWMHINYIHMYIHAYAHSYMYT